MSPHIQRALLPKNAGSGPHANYLGLLVRQLEVEIQRLWSVIAELVPVGYLGARLSANWVPLLVGDRVPFDVFVDELTVDGSLGGNLVTFNPGTFDWTILPGFVYKCTMGFGVDFSAAAGSITLEMRDVNTAAIHATVKIDATATTVSLPANAAVIALGADQPIKTIAVFVLAFNAVNSVLVHSAAGVACIGPRRTTGVTTL